MIGTKLLQAGAVSKEGYVLEGSEEEEDEEEEEEEKEEEEEQEEEEKMVAVVVGSSTGNDSCQMVLAEVYIKINQQIFFLLLGNLERKKLIVCF